MGSSTPRSTVTFQYSSESDHVGYPIPTSPRIEAGSDRHLLMVDTSACRLYELFDATLQRRSLACRLGGDLEPELERAPRPAGWTSADAAGLPIFPGLARYDEDGAGGDPPCPAFHRAVEACAGYVYAGPPRGRQRLMQRRAADGPASPAQGVGRHLAASRPRPG